MIHFTKKFGSNGITNITYSSWSRQIDFILVDLTIKSAIKKIGTLCLHEGIISDHVILYMDCDKATLFSGIINQPVRNHDIKFTIEHADKAEQFLERFRELAEKKLQG